MISIQLDREEGVYAPGDLLECNWRIGRIGLDGVQSVEASVLWYTEGKGDEDFAVHHFVRVPGDQLRKLGDSYQHSLVTALPMSPLTYDGQLLRIRWCVRLRIFLPNENDTVLQQPFFLGYADSDA